MGKDGGGYSLLTCRPLGAQPPGRQKWACPGPLPGPKGGRPWYPPLPSVCSVDGISQSPECPSSGSWGEGGEGRNGRYLILQAMKLCQLTCCLVETQMNRSCVLLLMWHYKERKWCGWRGDGEGSGDGGGEGVGRGRGGRWRGERVLYQQLVSHTYSKQAPIISVSLMFRNAERSSFPYVITTLKSLATFHSFPLTRKAHLLRR